MALYVPDQKAIEALASPAVFARGLRYWKDGAVSELARRGDTLSASVEGKADEPYAVTVAFSGKRIAEAKCTCPYELGGACKHVVAALIAYSAKPKSVRISPPITELLAKLDRDRLQTLLLKRLDSDHRLAGWLEAQIAMETWRGDAVDPKPLARQAHALLRHRYRSRNYWDDYSASGDLAELRQLTEAAVPLLEAGEGRAALSVLEAVSEAFVEDWIKYASGSDEHMYDLFNDLGRMIAEAALMSDLDADERGGLIDIVGGWKDDLAEFGVEEAFDPAILALETGWDAPGLADALAGKSRSWRPGGEDEWASGEVAAVMLRVLDAQDRREEYLNLARAVGQPAKYATMLVKLGRTAEALSFGLTKVENPEDALAIAKTLDAAGATQDALAVAKRGTELSNSDEGKSRNGLPLAQWLRDKAAASGQRELAILGGRAAFERSLSLDDFRLAKAAAGAEWEELRQPLLAAVAAARYAHDRIAVYLDEGMVDDAVRCVGQAKGFSPHDKTLLRLAATARRGHADWVVELATRMSGEIMNNNQAGYYELAARWLEQAMYALDDDGRTEDWLAMIGRLIETHRRKHKLRPLLEALRAGTFSHA